MQRIGWALLTPLLFSSITVPLLQGQSAAVLAGLAKGNYFPLDVGDRWVYRIDNRIQTAEYETWRVDRMATLNGNDYAVFAIEGPGTFYYELYYRADAGGRVYTPTATGEQLFLDPTGPAPAATLQITSQGGSVQSSLGTFPDTLNYVNLMPGNIIRETGTLARGIGLLNSTANMETGSSGGTVEIRTLVEATVAGLHFPAPLPAVELGIDSLSPDVTGRNVTNCAVPCYFVACYLGPGADPAGTYRPCAQARVALAFWPAGASHTVQVQFMAPDGSTPFSTTLTLDASPTESVTYVQVPLYSAPNVPLPSGIYQLAARSSDGLAQSALAIQIH